MTGHSKYCWDCGRLLVKLAAAGIMVVVIFVCWLFGLVR